MYLGKLDKTRISSDDRTQDMRKLPAQTYTGWFTDSGYFEMLITPLLFELSLWNKKWLAA